MEMLSFVSIIFYVLLYYYIQMYTISFIVWSLSFFFFSLLNSSVSFYYHLNIVMAIETKQK
jgi:hypothetical protein